MRERVFKLWGELLSVLWREGKERWRFIEGLGLARLGVWYVAAARSSFSWTRSRFRSALALRCALILLASAFFSGGITSPGANKTSVRSVKRSRGSLKENLYQRREDRSVAFLLYL